MPRLDRRIIAVLLLALLVPIIRPNVVWGEAWVRTERERARFGKDLPIVERTWLWDVSPRQVEPRGILATRRVLWAESAIEAAACALLAYLLASAALIVSRRTSQRPSGPKWSGSMTDAQFAGVAVATNLESGFRRLRVEPDIAQAAWDTCTTATLYILGGMSQYRFAAKDISADWGKQFVQEYKSLLGARRKALHAMGVVDKSNSGTSGFEQHLARCLADYGSNSEIRTSLLAEYVDARFGSSVSGKRAVQPICELIARVTSAIDPLMRNQNDR